MKILLLKINISLQNKKKYKAVRLIKSMKALSLKKQIFIATVSSGVVMILGGTEVISSHIVGLFMLILTVFILFNADKSQKEDSST